jgi:hypothetical protein
VQASLSSVTGISPTSVWAVGSQPGADTAHPRGLVMHGDATTWTEVAVPAPAVPAGGSWRLSHVTSTAGQVWAVGTTTSADSASQHSFVLHFDGATWSVATLPDLGPAYSYDTLYGIAAASPTSVWVTGSASTGNQRSVTFAEHYDGAGWTLTPTPSPAPSSGLAGVATNGASTWSVGSTTTSSGAFQTLIERFAFTSPPQSPAMLWPREPRRITPTRPGDHRLAPFRSPACAMKGRPVVRPPERIPRARRGCGPELNRPGMSGDALW